MQQLKEHIIFKGLVILLAIVLLTPTAVKFTHLFNHHKHEICKGEYQTHLHKTDVECNFYKFKLNNSFHTVNTFYEIEIPKIVNHKINSQYFFLSKYQKLHFALRGPPSYNLISV